MVPIFCLIISQPFFIPSLFMTAIKKFVYLMMILNFQLSFKIIILLDQEKFKEFMKLFILLWTLDIAVNKVQCLKEYIKSELEKQSFLVNNLFNIFKNQVKMICLWLNYT